MADWQPLVIAVAGLVGVLAGSPLALAVYKRRDDRKRDDTELVEVVQRIAREQLNDLHRQNVAYRVEVVWLESVVGMLEQSLRAAGIDVPPRPPRPVMLQLATDSDDDA